MEVRVRIPTPLRELVAGQAAVVVDVADDPSTVGAVLDALAIEHPACERHLGDLPADRTFFLSLDTLGSPHLLVLRGEGMFGVKEYPPQSLAVLDALAIEHPALERRVRDELGRTRAHVNLFVDADNVRDLDGLTTRIAPRQELSNIPAISGG